MHCSTILLVSTVAQTLGGERPASLLLVQGTGASEPKLPRKANVMFEPKPLLFEDDRSTTFAPGARNREDDVRMMVVVVVFGGRPSRRSAPWTPDPRSRNSHTANPASALQENGAQICAYDQTGGLSFPMQSCIRILQGSAASTFDSVHARECARAPRPGIPSVINKNWAYFPVLRTPHFTPPRWSYGP